MFTRIETTNKYILVPRGYARSTKKTNSDASGIVAFDKEYFFSSDTIFDTPGGVGALQGLSEFMDLELSMDDFQNGFPFNHQLPEMYL